jgi:hypothetical protein
LVLSFGTSASLSDLIELKVGKLKVLAKTQRKSGGAGFRLLRAQSPGTVESEKVTSAPLSDLGDSEIEITKHHFASNQKQQLTAIIVLDPQAYRY